MGRLTAIVSVFLASLAIPTNTLAQPTGTAQAQEARAVMQTVAKAMGTDKVNTLEYYGKGCQGRAPGVDRSPGTACTRFAVMGGQGFLGKGSEWPINEFSEYRRFIDFTAKAARREVAVVRASGAPAFGRGSGGNNVPPTGLRLLEYVNGNYNWDVRDNAPVAVFGHDGLWQFGSAPDFRQLEIWLTPHGFVKAALAAQDVTTYPRTEFNDDGTTFEMKVVTFTVLGKYRLTGLITPENLVESVETHIPDAAVGDMLHEYVYRAYENHDGVMFPSQIHTHTGDRFLESGSNAFNILVTDVKVNGTAPALTVPDTVRRATAPPVRVETQQLANGVWLLGGAAVSSVAIEFKNWVVIVEAPLNEARSLAVMAEVKRLVPNKPIRYVVNTHHHTDHAGGLRTYLTNGVTVITDELNREYYEDIVFRPAPRTVEPDRMSLSPVRTIYEGSNVIDTVSSNVTGGGIGPLRATNAQTYILSDRTRTLEIYPVRGLQHAGGMLVAYLPAEKILINSDTYSPRPVEGFLRNPQDIARFQTAIKVFGLDVDRHVSLEGGVSDNAAFEAAARAAATSRSTGAPGAP